MQEAINSARSLQPDVVLLDIHMPDGSGIEAVAAIKKDRPETQVVILTSDEDESVLRSAVQAGVTGYLSKHESAAQVVQAVRSAARGEALIAPYMLARLLHGLQKKDEPGPATPLTKRELEVLQLIAQGLSNRDIGERLFLALDTVKGHNRKIFGKLEAQSRTDALVRARALRLLP